MSNGTYYGDEILPVHKEQEPPKAKLRDLVAFWICGLLNNFGYTVMLSAALELLECANLSPAVVLLADILPSFIAQSLAPWFMQRIPYAFRIIFTVSLAVASFLIPAFFVPTWIKLIGVVCASIGSGFGEITFLAYSARFHKDTVSTWSSGTGGAGILGALSYLGLRYVLSAKLTLLVCSPLPLGILISYFFIMSRPEVHAENVQTGESASLLQTALPPIGEMPKPKLTAMERLSLMWQLLPYMTPLALVYYAEYLINQSIDPVLNFESDRTFSGKEYVYYQAIYQIGVFISRSSVNLVPIKNVYLLQLPAVFQVVNAIILSFDAWLNFIPSIWITFAIVLWEGLMGGAIYVNTFYLLSQKFEGEAKEFCMGATSMSYAMSITASALTGIVYTPFLTKARYGPHWMTLRPAVCSKH